LKDPKENDELALLYYVLQQGRSLLSAPPRAFTPISSACLWEHGFPHPSRVLELLAKSLEVFVVDWCMLL
jgi:hypothetical protein